MWTTLKSVKDKDNLLTYNQWSSTEYNAKSNNNIFNGFAQLGAVSTSNKHTTIGETSLKLTKTDSKWWFDVLLPTFKENNTYTFTADVYLESGLLRVLFYNNNNVLNEIWHNSLGKCSVSLSTFYETVTDPRIRFTIYENNGTPNAFIDNLRLTAQ